MDDTTNKIVSGVFLHDWRKVIQLRNYDFDNPYDLANHGFINLSTQFHDWLVDLDNLLREWHFTSKSDLCDIDNFIMPVYSDYQRVDPPTINKIQILNKSPNLVLRLYHSKPDHKWTELLEYSGVYTIFYEDPPEAED